MTIVWLEEVGSEDISLVGGKGASLGEMINAELPVPRGFAVTAPTFKRFIEETKIADKLFRALEVDVNDPAALRGAEKAAKDLILNTKMPPDIEKEILDAYEELCRREGKNVFVAVRSSATAEDLPGASFAGQQDTLLNISGGKAVVDSVKKCWASLYGARAIFYRVKQGFDHRHVYISTVVQKMVDAEKAGVMFTSHPTSGEPLSVIEASWGLGETVVSGAISPDNYVVDRRTGSIIQRKISSKSIMHVRDPKTGRTIKKEVPKDLVDKPVLSDDEVLKLTEFGELVERHYDSPQDVEWAIEKEKIYMLQSRPITTIQKMPVKEAAKATGKVILDGLGASPGLAHGKVRIVMQLDELDKVSEGDILVTTMTTPDMVPAMKRAAGIITDEGGLTCFTGDTRVLTDKGIIELEKLDRLISSGEYVHALSVNKDTLSPEWKRVLSSMKRTSNVWEVAVSQTGRAKQNTLKITPNHKMLTFDDRKLVERELESLLGRNEAVIVVDRVPAPFNEFDGASDCSEDLAYLAGAIFSDGHIRLTNRRGSVTFRQKNIPEKLNYINSVREAFNREFSTRLTDYGEDVSFGVIRGREMVGSANRYVCSQKKPATKLLDIRDNLEEVILRLGEEVIVKFLAGSIDGDGSFNIAHESGK
ncbi:MAG: PEP/pyruvate-binding domain-containing protein, partial [Methanocellales archaeon]|nr:PEP/pyruvate-binding domain-containing protein [Methanocellales archaeon]